MPTPKLHSLFTTIDRPTNNRAVIDPAIDLPMLTVDVLTGVCLHGGPPLDLATHCDPAMALNPAPDLDLPTRSCDSCPDLSRSNVKEHGILRSPLSISLGTGQPGQRFGLNR